MESERAMQILIAEDDLTTRKVLETLLARWGYDVVTVGDGLAAWELLRSEEGPRLAILDWMMPGRNGVDICREIRLRQVVQDRYLYIILLSSRSTKEETVIGLEAGADDYIAKPFDPPELLMRVRVGQRILDLQAALVAAKESLHYLAMHDTLTGIFSRRAILERLDEELKRAVRQNSPLAVAMLDLDHFKLINDTYGHQAGDEVLKECAERIRRIMRPYDSLGRYGGEEFLILAPSYPLDANTGLFDRIRSSISDHPIIYQQQTIRVTASLGVTVSDHHDDPEGLIKAADAALYRAKEKGRNCVEIFLPGI